MALKVTKVDVWAGDLRDVPGGLAEVLEQVATGGQSIQFVIARRDDKQTGRGKVFLTPVSSARAKEAAMRAGLQRAAKVATLRVEGTDKPGLGSRITRVIADAGINLRGVSAAVIASRFVAYLGFDGDEDAAAAIAALKGAKLDAAGRKRPGSRASSGRRAAGRASPGRSRQRRRARAG